ncbi:MAG: VWA domain-containing protein [Hyphomicrobiaceae bacterium]|nr:VWA domain-containing protein [Hyphomicrobiaceae bacterium]
MAIWHFWEPEETVGSAWHGAVRRFDAEPVHEEAAVSFEQMRPSIGVIFRAAGGAQGAEIVATAARVSHHRLSFWRRLGHDVDHVTEASYDGVRLALPARIALFPTTALNRDAYLWLAAIAAHIVIPERLPRNPLARDLARLRLLAEAEWRALQALPGLAGRRERLGEALLALRRVPKLPADEAGIEARLRELLKGLPPQSTAEAVPQARDDYQPFRPVVFWPRIEVPLASVAGADDGDEPQAGTGAAEGSDKAIRAERRPGEQADRKDPMILNRFESILSWAEFLNINRRVEDEDEGTAKKAAEDLDNITLAKNSKAAATKLKFHLDLSPKDVDTARLIGETTLPEWDWKRGAYLPDHVRVFESLADSADAGVFERPRARRRIAAVKRQFEALRPRRRVVRRQTDGFDLDLDEVVRSAADLKACGHGSDRLYAAIRDDERDLAVSVLVDVSRSTESAVGGRQVIEIAREALVALTEGLDACGDAVSVHAFSSLRRERVMIDVVKDFAEPIGATVRGRIAGLTPKHYTRLGAAIRHVSRHLEQRAASRRLLVVLTDGKPNDLDHYEGRHGSEDTRRAVTEARRKGQAVFAITVDAKARDYLPHLFGRNGYAVVADPDRLVEALPEIYRHVVA